MSLGKTTIRCSQCGKSWPSATTVCPNDGTQLSTVIAQAPWNASNTAIDPPFNGSLTDLDSLRASVRASGSVSPTDASFHSLGPTNVILQRAATGELVPDTRISEYEIEDKIGEGAMGAVYRAVHPTIGKRVAVKIMNPKLCDDLGAIERFTREARSVAAIRHPGIVDVFGFGTLADGRAYLIMEWLEGTSLGARLQHGSFTVDETLDILNQTARALEAAHAKNVIHRDLKPDNVFLQYVAGERPVVKILDFGLAKLVDEDDRIAKTKSGELLGTPVYMSPEQCRGKDVDYRTDIYALGCIAYELICGRVPFDADNTAELIAAHLSEQPPTPGSLQPDVPAQLDGLMFAMLAKDPSKRPTLQQIRQTIATVRGMTLTPVPGTLRRSKISERLLLQDTPAPLRARRYMFIGLTAVVAVGVGVALTGRTMNVVVLSPDAGVDANTTTVMDAGAADAVPVTVKPVVDKSVVDKPVVDKPTIKKVDKPTVKKVEKPLSIVKPLVEKQPDPGNMTINPFKKKPPP